MGSLRFGDFSDAPVMVLPPYHHHSFDPSSLYYSSLQQFYSGIPIKTSLPTSDIDIPTECMDSEPLPSTPTSNNPPSSCNKRKRDNTDDGSDARQDQHVTAAAPSVFKCEPKYEGTVLVCPSHDHPISTKSQTGTWPDEKLEAESKATTEPEALTVEAKDELELLPRQKYRRGELPSLSTDALVTSLPKGGIEEPTIDQFTRLLGIGWTRIASDLDVQKATRGWARYIENHYPLHSVEVLLTSKAFDGAVLVFARDGSMATREGFFLFREDLSEGRLVALDWETCVGRLQASPLLYEGNEELKAAKTPTISAMRVHGGCAMLPDSEGSFATLPADDVMVCD